MIAEKLRTFLVHKLNSIGLTPKAIVLEHPTELSFGDYASNVALSLAKESGKNPKELAGDIVKAIEETKPDWLEKVEVAGPGFVNFHLTKEFFTETLQTILTTEDFGKQTTLSDKKIIAEYTDPNLFKEFHIGHLMTNTIGESISRIAAWNGADIKRACYQSDVGLNIAKSVWGIMANNKDITTAQDLGVAYAEGAKAFESDENAKQEIIAINKKIYDKSDSEINTLYEKGKTISLSYFEEIYKKLGTTFDYYFFESETGTFGATIVSEFLKKEVFKESEGAIIFPGEQYGLHTRVFINKEGLPTYEAKELGLAKIKYDKYPYDESIVITANEVNDYFRVLLKALELTFPELAAKTKHLSHGMMRLPSGKMSSRTGDVIIAESLIATVKEEALRKMADRISDEDEKQFVALKVALAAIKYSILRQSPGKDVIFDQTQALSFEGDSGPYLQYTYARIQSILAKAKEEGISSGFDVAPQSVFPLERLLYRFEEKVAESYKEYAPHVLTTYLIEIARSFNALYAETQIANPGDPESSYKVGLSEATGIILKNGLTILGIEPILRM